MTASTEPSRLTAGDTLAWTRTLTDYPASAGWVLKYRLINAAGKIDITASASGADHAISVPAATSAAWLPGIYAWQSWVEKGVERYTQGTGQIEIARNLAGETAGLETRSNARQILDALLAAYALAAAKKAFVGEYEIEGRRMRFNAKPDWLLEIQFWQRQVAAEKRAERLANGQGSGGKIFVRF